MGSTARAALLAAVIGIVPAIAWAQAPAPTATGPQPQPQPAPAPSDTGAAGTAPAAEPSASAKPVVPATGYGWSTTPKRHVTHPRTRAARAGTPDAILPGFETLADGSTRLFVILTRPVQYETKPGRGTITYVLKGAYVDKRNNFNPLVTVHFNTPVTSARLVPHGNDLWFVVDLRANVTPTVTMDATKDGGAMLRIDMPKGDYLPGAAPPTPPTPPTPPVPPAAAPSPTPAPAHPPAPAH
jgi:hypothetical protein